MSTQASESQVRRLAARRGVRLTKLRRDNAYNDEARYVLTDPGCSNVLLTSEYGVDLADALELIAGRSVD
jgi:hypothetical protein